ncbi:hypothetical protein LDENG_00038500 [Lucifuga dentata]|nr:hypothetical protein LDENG_00038500 [Lucifuga dentata]
MKLISPIIYQDHSLVIKDLNPYINKGYLQAYFREWGIITACKVKKSSDNNDKSVAYVRFLTEAEADKADWAGPRYTGGYEVEARRVVSPKMAKDSEEEVTAAAVTIPRPRCFMGLGYILENA